MEACDSNKVTGVSQKDIVKYKYNNEMLNEFYLLMNTDIRETKTIQ